MKAAHFLVLLIAAILIIPHCFGADSSWATNELGGIENATIIAKPVSVKAWRTVGSLELESPSFSIADLDRKSTRLNSSHYSRSRMPSSA